MYFHIPRVEKFSFDVDRSVALYNLVSAIGTRKMLRHGCQGYLVLVRDTSVKGVNVEHVPVVRKFVNVFTEKLLGLLPDREIEFRIDIVQGTNPISMPPCRMAPTELKELKEQLQELLDKGFI